MPLVGIRCSRGSSAAATRTSTLTEFVCANTASSVSMGEEKRTAGASVAGVLVVLLVVLVAVGDSWNGSPNNTQI
jgi:hypothetical protein